MLGEPLSPEPSPACGRGQGEGMGAPADRDLRGPSAPSPHPDPLPEGEGEDAGSPRLPTHAPLWFTARMNEVALKEAAPAWRPLAPEKFRDPLVTARGERRAHVDLVALRTLWFNTGTLCNITCANCYIESSPRNDRLAYLGVADLTTYL